MKTNKKTTFTVSKEEYETVFKFFAFLNNIDSDVYDDVREVIMDDNNEFYDMVDILLTSLDYPKESATTAVDEAIQTIADYCDNNEDCTTCPLHKKCRFTYPYTWKETSQS